MNIFVLDENIEKSASFHCDTHIIKMPLETAQLLCTCLNLNEIKSPYKTTHKNHPCSLWVRESIDNYLWLCNFGLALCKEYTFRYKKIHKCEQVIQFCLDNAPELPEVGITPFKRAIPDEYKESNAIKSYRNYYIGEKLTNKNGKQNTWKDRPVPYWINL